MKMTFTQSRIRVKHINQSHTSRMFPSKHIYLELVRPRLQC